MRNWTREIIRGATVLVGTTWEILIALACCISAALAAEHFTMQTPSIVPRPVIKQQLPSGLGYELRYSPYSQECFIFPVSQTLDSGWQVVLTCPDSTLQRGAAPYYGEALLQLPGIVQTDAVRLWPLDFMPSFDACPGPWVGPLDDPTAGGVNVGGLVFVRSTQRAYLCTQGGWRLLTLD